mgnify:FL=1
MALSAKELVKKSSGIYALPELNIKLKQKLEDPASTNQQIADIVQLDAGLSASLLKIANSAFYGFPSTISSISQAISIIGRIELADLVLGKSVIQIFSNTQIDKDMLEKHWKHSLLCGLTARLLTKSMVNPEQSADSMFVAGLLHDIGKLVIWQDLPEKSQAIFDQLDPKIPNHAFQLEKAVLGFEHAETGSELLKSWKLPQVLIESTHFHHCPEEAPQFEQASQLVSLANQLSNQWFSTEMTDEGDQQLLLSKLGLTKEQVDTALDLANDQLMEMSALFLA